MIFHTDMKPIHVHKQTIVPMMIFLTGYAANQVLAFSGQTRGQTHKKQNSLSLCMLSCEE